LHNCSASHNTAMCARKSSLLALESIVVLVRGHPVRGARARVWFSWQLLIPHRNWMLEHGRENPIIFITVREPKTTTATVDQKQQQPWLKSW